MSINLTNKGITVFDADDRGGAATCTLSCDAGRVVVIPGNSGVVFMDAFETGRLLHLQFEEGTGTTTADISGNGYNGTLVNGPTWVTGKTGFFAVNFDGSNDQITIPTAMATAFTGNKFTLSAWVKPTSLVNDATVFSIRLDSSHLVSMKLGGSGTGGNTNACLQILNGAGSSAFTGGGQISANAWHLWTFTYDGSQSTANNRVQFYLDGVLQTLTFSGTTPTAIPGLGTAVPCLGRRGDNLLPYTGVIDDMRAYLRVLSQTEITNLYNRNSVSFNGTMTQLNSLFRGLTTGEIAYTNSTAGPVNFTMSVEDEDSLTTSISFAGTVAAYVAPVITVPGGTLSATVGTPLTLQGTGFAVSDADDNGEFATGTLSITSGPGAITVSPGNSGVEVTANNGTAAVSLVGRISAFNNLFTGAGTGTIVFESSTSTGSPSTLKVDIIDSTEQEGSATQSISSANAPVVTAPSAYLTVHASTDLNIHGAGFNFSDASATGSTSMTALVTITGGAGTCTLTAAATSGLTLSGSGTASLTATGTFTNVQNFLTGANGTLKFNDNTIENVAVTVKITNNVTGLFGSNSIAVVVNSNAATWTGFALATAQPTNTTITNFVGVIDLSKMPGSWWLNVQTDGRDIRVTTDAAPTVSLPSHVLHFDHVNQLGVCFVKFQNASTAPALRVWVGANNATIVQPTDPTGQYAVYDSGTVRAFWPDGSGNDMTANANNLTAHNVVVATDASTPVGYSSLYDTGSNSYARMQGGSAAAAPETLLTFAQPTGTNATRYEMSSIHGTQYNMLTHENNKCKAWSAVISGSVDKASAVGSIQAGVWQLMAACFPATNNRIAYLNGGNTGNSTTNISGSGGVNGYALGCFGGNDGGVSTVSNYSGNLCLSMILANLPQSIIDAWIANWALMFNQATYWGTWSWNPQSQTGL